MEITAGGPISAFVETATRNARACTRLATRCHEDPMMAQDRGYRVPAVTASQASPLRDGGALANSLPKKGSVQGRLETQKGPASEEAGLIDTDVIRCHCGGTRSG